MIKSARDIGELRHKRAIVFGICLLLVLAVWLVFGQTLGHDFVNYDDDVYVYKNPRVTGGLTIDGIKWAFTHNHAHNWHPLTTISHMLDCQLFGVKAAGHHVTNILFHAITAVLLFLVFSQMTGALWRSLFVATLFAIHPLRVESVAWVAERKDVLSGLLFVLTLAAYLRYVRKPSLARYLLVALIYALGLMAKPMLVTVPLVLLLLDYWPLGRFVVQGRTRRQASWRHAVWLKLVWEKLPFLILSAASCAATLAVQRHGIKSMETLPLLSRIGNALSSYVIYIWQMFWPAHLAVFYPYPSGSISIWIPALALAVLLEVTYIAWIFRKERPYLITGWFWYLGMLVPVIGIFQVGLQAHADRYTYLPHIGVYLLVTWTIADLAATWSSRRATLGLAATAVISALSFSAWKQTSYWKDSEVLWTHTLATTGLNSIAHHNLGEALLDRGKVDEAISNFREALKILPNDARMHSSLATALIMKDGDANASEAFNHWQVSLRLEPENVNARDRFGVALAQQGRLRDAIEQWQESLRYDADDGNARFKLAWVLATAPDPFVRDGVKAVQFAEQVLQLSGSKNAMVFRTLAAAYAESGRFPEAIGAAERGLQLASEQANGELSSELQGNIALYRAHTALRDSALAKSPP
jgi:tetratricopeptide (TPR) repeat protein